VEEIQYDYDIFGRPILTIEAYASSIRYAGEFYDVEVGLYYLRARYYDPYIGRFVSEDTYRGQANDPLSLNLYAYVLNNPLIYWDPTGHWEQGDQNLSANAQADIIALTNAYWSASTKDERNRIHAQANAIRKANASQKKNEQLTPVVVQASAEVQFVATQAVNTKQFTKDSWDKLLGQADITYTSSPSYPNSGQSIPTVGATTTTKIGYTNIVVTTKDYLTISPQPDKQKNINPNDKNVNAKLDAAYGVGLSLSKNWNDLSKDNRLFVDQVKKSAGGAINEEQAVTILAIAQQGDSSFTDLLMDKYDPSSLLNQLGGFTSNYQEMEIVMNSAIEDGSLSKSLKKSLQKYLNGMLGGISESDYNEFYSTLINAKGGNNQAIINAFFAKEAVQYFSYNEQLEFTEKAFIVEDMLLSLLPLASLRSLKIKGTGKVGSAYDNVYTSTKPLDDVFPELKGVNTHYVEGGGPGVNINCVSCANAAQARLTGRDPSAVASPSNGYGTANDLLQSAPFGTRKNLSVADVNKIMSEAGDGTSGIVVINQGNVDHVINVVNRSGTVYYVDTQIGKIVNLNPNLVLELGLP
jgi:RHS repeat-associated protein